MSKLNDAYKKAAEEIGSLTSLVASKKELIVKQAINVALLLIILFITGCLDWMHVKFDLSLLKTTNYWGTLTTKLIGGISAFLLGVNFLWDLHVQNDEALKKAKREYDILCQYIDDLDFEEFVVKVFNPVEKRKAYISQINRRIYLLNKVARKKDKLLYSSDLPENQEKKLTNKYCIIRKQLEELKKEEYIAKNLDTLDVRYHEVDPAIFQLTIDANIKSTGVVTKGSVVAGKFKASANVILGIITLSAFFTALVLEPNKAEFETQAQAAVNYVAKATSDVGVILWQLFRGIMNSKKIITNEITIPYVGRVIVLTKYINWRRKKGINVVIKEFNEKETEEDDDDTEYVEMTKEEFEKYKQSNATPITEIKQIEQQTEIEETKENIEE